MPLKVTTSCLQDSLDLFRYYKKLGERAMAQVDDTQLGQALDRESNSIAVIVKHMAGNMRSRWTDFLTADGEKPLRDRDSEFVETEPSREELLGMWNEGWAYVFGALDSLSDADLARTVTIRGEPHSVMQAVHRQIAHYSYHVGQIVFLAKHFVGEQWETLSIARNRSAAYNRKVENGEPNQR